MRVLLQLSTVSFQYVRKPILNTIDLTIPTGQIIGLVGENGSGKSTLLKLMAGLLTPTSGTITMHNKPLTRRNAGEIAYMPDTDLFYDFYTGEQLFGFYASQFPDFSYEKACIITEDLQVERHTKLKNLSKGNRGKMKMAATLGRNVPLYIFDEPFGGLDPMAREALIKSLIRFSDAQTQTIFLSTHEVQEVEPILDQILLLRNGTIVAQEQIEDIRDFTQQDAVQWMKSLYKQEVK